MIDVITRINMSDFDLNLVTASISPSIQDVRELHALSPPSAARYALDGTIFTTLLDGTIFTTLLDGTIFTTLLDGTIFTTLLDGTIFTTLLDGTIYRQ